MNNVDDVIDGIISDLVDGLIDLPDEEIDAKLAEYDLDPDDVADIKDLINAERMANSDAVKNPLSIDKVDNMADNAAEKAQEMANEDNTPVKVTETDKDSDGDADKIEIEQKNNEDDSEKPHDLELSDDDKDTQKNIISALSDHRF